MKKLTEDRFYEKFTTVKNHLVDSCSFDDCMFETYGEEVEYVHKAAKKGKNVWTIIDNNDGGNWFICTGFHYVNRMGYLITEEKYEEEFEVELDF